MVFNIEDRILVKNLYKFKGYKAKNKAKNLYISWQMLDR